MRKEQNHANRERRRFVAKLPSQKHNNQRLNAHGVEPFEKDKYIHSKITTEQYTVMLELCKHPVCGVKELIPGNLNHLKVNTELVNNTTLLLDAQHRI